MMVGLFKVFLFFSFFIYRNKRTAIFSFSIMMIVYYSYSEINEKKKENIDEASTSLNPNQIRERDNIRGAREQSIASSSPASLSCLVFSIIMTSQRKREAGREKKEETFPLLLEVNTGGEQQARVIISSLIRTRVKLIHALFTQTLVFVVVPAYTR